MNILTGLSAQPKQQSAFVLSDGSQVSLYLEYRPQQMGWFFDLTWQSITLNGQRLAVFPNILRQWQRLLPFGVAVVSTGDVEPLNVTDLSDGTVTLLVLTAEDVARINTEVFTGG